MKISKRALCALMVCVSFISSQAQHPDINRMQSAQLPAPEWVKGAIDQGEHDPRLKGYFTPPGLKLEIVADYPTVVNPVGMTFDDKGTAYVLEWLPGGGDWNEVKLPLTYKDGTKRDVAVMKKTIPDVVKVLTDSKRTGVYDTAKVIIEDELPSSILVHDGWVYLSGRGTVRRFKQSKGAGAYDVKETIAQGFCGFHHHQVSGLTVGNDGRLYMTSGDDDNVVEGSDGSRATVYRTGAIFRSRLDGSKMELFARGLRNPYRDVAFDSQHNMFHADNDNEDGTKFTGCRLLHVAEGADYGWRLSPGARCCLADTARGAAFGEMPGKMQPMLKTGRGAPAGLLIYNDSQLPAQYRDLLLYPDVFRKVVRAYSVAPEGSTFKVTHEFELLKSEDPLFRPNQMVTGPDGAIYIVDWRTDSGGAGRLSGDGQHGRIYRLTWSGTSTEPALPRRSMSSWDLSLTSEKGLLESLAGPDETLRRRAQRELAHRNQTGLLLEVMADEKKPLPARMAALGGGQRHWDKKVEQAVMALLKSGLSPLRRLAADALALNGARGTLSLQEALAPLLKDADLKVKRAAVLAVAKIGAKGSSALLGKTFAELTPAEIQDRYLGDALLRGFESGGVLGMEELVSLAKHPNAGVKKRALEASFGLRSRESAVAIEKLLDLEMVASDRIALFKTFNNIQVEPPVDVLKPVLNYFRRNGNEAKEVKLAALEVLGTTASLRGRDAADFLLTLIDDNDVTLQIAALKAAEESGADSINAELVKRVVGKHSADVRAHMVRTLRNLQDKTLLPLLPQLIAKNESALLRLEAFRSLSALDSKQAEELARTLVFEKDLDLVIEAVGVAGRSPKGAKFIGVSYTEKKLPALTMTAVAESLQKFKEGDKEILALWTQVTKDGLVLSMKPDEVAKWKNEMLSHGNAQRGREVFLNSNIVSCNSCHRIEGFGGNVGPDLTRVWDTQSFEKLMEAIVEPSREIKEGYQTYSVSTVQGQAISGLKLKEDDKEVVLKDAGGKVTRVAKADIDEIKASPKSIMPEGSVSKLSPAQFVDLMAFLRSRSAQESLRGVGLEFWVAGPFSKKATEEFVDVKITRPGSEWKLVRVDPTGSLNFRALYHADNISAYALTRVYSPKAQDAVMLLGSDDGARVWLNGEKVHEALVDRGAQSDDENMDKVPMKLKVGWNTILVRVFNGTLSHELYLRFANAGELVVNPNAQ